MLFDEHTKLTPQKAWEDFQIRLRTYQRISRTLTGFGIICSIAVSWMTSTSAHTAFFITGAQLLAIGSTAACLSLWIYLSLLDHKLTNPLSRHVQTRHRKSAPITQPS
jgi:hypothetical protein